jgi:hypothetical protein
MMHRHARLSSVFRRLDLLLVLVPAFLCRASDDVVAPQRQRIADVQAGRVHTAYASWWGFDPADATPSLQAALNSPAREVVIENMGCPWIVTTIHLPGNKDVVLEAGVIVQAKKGEFLDKHTCLFAARGRKHLTIRGEDAVFRMLKEDYHRPP